MLTVNERENKHKDDHIQIKINKDDKKDFFEICKENAINPSEWLRNQIAVFTRLNRLNRSSKTKIDAVKPKQ